MENYLIVIVFIVSIIYKIYTNYKEEVEKAKKRQPQRVPIPQTEVIQTNKPSNKVSTPYSVEQVQYNSHVQKNEAIMNPVPDEVKRLRDLKENLRPQPKEEESFKNENISFDLRQAVIQSIILERPYK